MNEHLLLKAERCTMRKRDDEKEQRIKEAVISLILQDGLTGASISKIAREAGVSPATVYIYYDNKEDMLQDIYSECSNRVYDFLEESITPEMSGQQLIATLMRSYYQYMLENQEVFSFVEQFSNCPSLTRNCAAKRGICQLFALIADLKKKRIIKNYSDENLAALIFSPIKVIAEENRDHPAAGARQLEEMIKIVQSALLV